MIIRYFTNYTIKSFINLHSYQIIILSKSFPHSIAKAHWIFDYSNPIIREITQDCEKK